MTQRTIDHFEIRRWAISKGATPARDENGELVLDFESDSDLESLTWDEFFEQFDRELLAMEYEENKHQARLIEREEAMA